MSETFSDFIFEVEEHEFKAHKAIVAGKNRHKRRISEWIACFIAARSPVLARMMSSDYLEAAEGRMTITIPELTADSALDLLVVADKYEFLTLKNVCDEFLLASLRTGKKESAVDIFDIAHKHSCSRELIEEAFKAIKE